jgi:hypothetical protein
MVNTGSSETAGATPGVNLATFGFKKDPTCAESLMKLLMSKFKFWNLQTINTNYQQRKLFSNGDPFAASQTEAIKFAVLDRDLSS